MALCPICNSLGELGHECPNDHSYYVDAKDLERAPEGHLLGQLVGGQYIPLSIIGEGGMGRIYRAKAKYTGKTLALKILKSEFMEDETLRDRFFREAEVVSALEHPNIVSLYGCAPDEKHNTIYMAMELLSGRTLFDVLRRGAPVLPKLIRWFIEISDGLGVAHKNGIFHRDLKPENIFIVSDSEGNLTSKILDFGFARLQGAAKKLTMAGVAFGTPHYMSPEQAMGMTEITAAVDVYALGVMLYQAITGYVPFDSKSNSPMEVMYDQVHKEAPPIVVRREYQVPQRLVNCIKKCMNKAPKDRFPDGNALHDELVEIEKIILKELEATPKLSLTADSNVTPAKLIPISTPKPSSKDLKRFTPSLNQVLSIVLVFLVIAIVLIIAWML